MHVYPAHLTTARGVRWIIKVLSILLISARGHYHRREFCAGESLGDGDGSVAPPALQLPLPDHFQPTGSRFL